MQRILLPLLFLLAIVHGNRCLGVDATQSGDWNDTATWGGNPVPGLADVARIPQDVEVFLSANASVGQLNIDGVTTGEIPGRLTINAGQILTLDGNGPVGGSFISGDLILGVNAAMTIDDEEVEVTGRITLDGGAAIRIAGLHGQIPASHLRIGSGGTLEALAAGAVVTDRTSEAMGAGGLVLEGGILDLGGDALTVVVPLDLRSGLVQGTGVCSGGISDADADGAVIIAPGPTDGPGTLTVQTNEATFHSTSVFNLHLQVIGSASPTVDSDRIIMPAEANQLTLDQPQLVLSQATVSDMFQPGLTFVLIEMGEGAQLNGHFANLTEGARLTLTDNLSQAWAATITYAGGDGDDVAVTIDGPAGDYTWNNADAGSWSTAANWTPAGTPGANDLVAIDNGGTATADSPVSALDLTFAGSTLQFGSTGSLQVDRLFDWTGGALLGGMGNQVTIGSAATLLMDGSGTPCAIDGITLQSEPFIAGTTPTRFLTGTLDVTGACSLQLDGNVSLVDLHAVLAGGANLGLTLGNYGSCALANVTLDAGATLTLAGSTTITGTVTATNPITAQGVFTGTGTIDAPLHLTTMFSAFTTLPGQPFVLVQGLQMEADSQFAIYLESDASASQVTITGGDIHLGALQVIAYPITFTNGTAWTIIDNQTANPIATPFTGLAQGASVDLGQGQQATLSYVGGDGNDVVLTVGTAVLPTITAISGDTSTYEGYPATFTVTATSALSYQWQIMPIVGQGTWLNVDGETTASLVTAAPTIAQSGDQYRCVVTGTGGSVNSAAMTLTVLPIVPPTWNTNRPVPTLAVAGQTWQALVEANEGAGPVLPASVSGSPAWLQSAPVGTFNGAVIWKVYGKPPGAGATDVTLAISNLPGGASPATWTIRLDVHAATTVPVTLPTVVPGPATGPAPYTPICLSTEAGVASWRQALAGLDATQARGFAWNPAANDYLEFPAEPANGLTPYHAVFLATRLPLSLNLDGVPLAMPGILDLKPGWNFLGVPPLYDGTTTLTTHPWLTTFTLQEKDGASTDAARFIDILGTPAGTMDSTRPWWWNGSAYVQVDTLTSGTGYWFKNNGNADMRLVRGTSGMAAPRLPSPAAAGISRGAVSDRGTPPPPPAQGGGDGSFTTTQEADVGGGCGLGGGAAAFGLLLLLGLRLQGRGARR